MFSRPVMIANARSAFVSFTMVSLLLLGAGCSKNPTAPKVLLLDSNGNSIQAIPTPEQIKAAAPPGATFFSAMIDGATVDHGAGASTGSIPLVDLYSPQPANGRIVILRIDFIIRDPDHTLQFWSATSLNAPDQLIGRYRIPLSGGAAFGGYWGTIFLGVYDGGNFGGGLEFPFGPPGSGRTTLASLKTADGSIDYATIYGYVF